ncbi:MAG TPA: type II toxin-antitoxin system HicB family antitoxin [Chloroflexota bacterium]|nr:type II toxin-antitoxin system HicB family antitoxin [Chloroflexota bacterium]
MLTEYVNAAMRHAVYETMEDDNMWGEIPGFPGLWAAGATRTECERELRSTLEDWILIATRFGDTLPTVDGIDINVHVAA